MKALSATCGFTPSFPDIGGRRGPCEGSLFPFPAVSPLPPHGLPTPEATRLSRGGRDAKSRHPRFSGARNRRLLHERVSRAQKDKGKQRAAARSGAGRAIGGGGWGGHSRFSLTPQVR